MNKTTQLFYKDRPMFGLDIGASTVRVIQFQNLNGTIHLLGYGSTKFDSGYIKDGVIVNIEDMAKKIHDLFDGKIVGKISTRRVAIGVPAVQTFSRVITVPNVKQSDLTEAVQLETEQYMPLPMDELYTDFETLSVSKDILEVLVVAIPKPVVDSRVALANILGLEIETIEPTINAGARFFAHTDKSRIPTILVDLDHISSDIAAFDTSIKVISSVPGGGDNFIQSIAKKLDITDHEAILVKNKYGLNVSKKQKPITEALKPTIDSMLREIKRTIRYYEDRNSDDRKISQVVTMGSGANMPGLSDYMTQSLRMPVRMCNPWQYIGIKDIQPPSITEEQSFITCAGLALTSAKEVLS